MNDLERKIRWFFKAMDEKMSLDDFELLKIGHFSDEGDVIFRNGGIKWRDLDDF